MDQAVTTVTDCQVLILFADDLASLAKDMPELAERISRAAQGVKEKME